jgi:riboflavin kinase / FMN adenylyltransferase
VNLIRHLDQLPVTLQQGAVAIGNFDGVHRGHARIVERLISVGRSNQGPAVAFTFDPHPAALLRPATTPPPLTTTPRKAELLTRLGVDAVIAYPTDRQLLELSPQEFFEHIVLHQLHARALVEGPNFFFGRRRTGDIRMLETFCRKAGVGLEIVAPLTLDGDIVSSSRIRRALARGDVSAAARLLGRPHRIEGRVQPGAGRGAKLGFPTANLTDVETLLPQPAVYACRAWVGDDAYPAAVNVGGNPTFDEPQHKIEAHLIDFRGSLYEQTLRLDFHARLRDIRPFASVEALIEQLQHDVQTVRDQLEKSTVAPDH